MAEQIAQATQAPANGASNAEDFQPQTRNPQSNVVPTQPQTNNLQTPTSMEVLSNENLRIIVPGSNGDAQADVLGETSVSDSGPNMFLIFVIVFAAILGIGALLSAKRQKVSVSEANTIIPKKVVESAPPKKKPKRSKKSKSKRKRK